MSTDKQKEALLPVYLIVGEDELKRDAVLKRLRTRIAEIGDITFNSDEFVGGHTAGIDIVNACNTLPFASERRLVLVRDVGKLKNTDIEALIQYLQSPSPTTVLALVAEKLAKNTRLYKTATQLGDRTVIDCVSQKKYELVKTIRRMATSSGMSFTEKAAQVLIEQVGENTVRLSSELEKIILAHQGKNPVDEHEVRSMVSRTSEVKPWEFVDAFASRNLVSCIQNLEHMSSSSPHSLIALCVTRLRELICTRSLIDRGCSNSLARTLGLPDWKVKNHIAHAKNYTTKELRNALIAARDAEQAMKSGVNAETVFLDWTIAVVKS